MNTNMFMALLVRPTLPVDWEFKWVSYLFPPPLGEESEGEDERKYFEL
jgi:hypothetical protein